MNLIQDFNYPALCIISILLGYWAGSMLQDPDVMQHFVYYPQEKFTTCGKRIYNEATSAEWFHSAFNESHASEDGKLKAGHLFLGIGLLSDGSAIDKM